MSTTSSTKRKAPEDETEASTKRGKVYVDDEEEEEEENVDDEHADDDNSPQEPSTPTAPNPITIPVSLETSSTSPPSPSSTPPDQWGFVVYRTSYTSDSLWDKAKTIISAISSSSSTRQGILDANGDPSTATLKYISNREELDGKTAGEIRVMFNPNYKANVKNATDDEEEDEEDEEAPTAPERSDSLCNHVCLVLDDAAISSILAYGEDNNDTATSSSSTTTRKPPHIIAIDAESEKSEQWTFGEADPEVAAAKRVEWDGTMKVAVGSIFDEFYLRNVGEGSLVMGEIHPDGSDEVWDG